MADRILRVATRASRLALAQTGMVTAELERLHQGLCCQVVQVKTKGDKFASRPLSEFRGLGIFVKELEEYLLRDKADLAVHSLKDVPSEQVKGLVMAAFPARENPYDVLLTRSGEPPERLAANARVGTGSPRRLVQLKAFRPDLAFLDLRGNLDTRMRKLMSGAYDAIVTAAAGLVRLGIEFNAACQLPPELCLPAAGQGSLALECREDDRDAIALARSVHNPATECEVNAERLVLNTIGSGCRMPVAALALTSGATVSLAAMAGDPASGKIVRLKASGNARSIDSTAIDLARELLARCKSIGIDIAAHPLQK